MRTDRYGLPVTTANDAAVVHFDEAVKEYVGFKREPLACVKRALEADPNWDMGHGLRDFFC